MKSRYVRAGAAVVVAASFWLGSIAAEAAQPARCRFMLGFNDVREMVGTTTVGECLEDEWANPDNGDARQRTTNGELVWRKASSTTAFTNGYQTWVLGPQGLQRRLNTERFAWEPDAAQFPRPAQATTAQVAPTSTPARGTPTPTRPVASPSPATTTPIPAAVPAGGATPTATATSAPSFPPVAVTPVTAPATAPSGAPAPMGRGVLPANQDDCPSTHPIKGNRVGRTATQPGDPIYHVPGSQSYDVTDPEECFATEVDAQAAGYRPPER